MSWWVGSSSPSEALGHAVPTDGPAQGFQKVCKRPAGKGVERYVKKPAGHGVEGHV